MRMHRLLTVLAAALAFAAPPAVVTAQRSELDLSGVTRAEMASAIREVNTGGVNGFKAPKNLRRGGPGGRHGPRYRNPFALDRLGRHKYRCRGDSCCTYTCPVGSQCCRSPRYGYIIPQYWQDSLNVPTSSCSDTVRCCSAWSCSACSCALQLRIFFVPSCRTFARVLLRASKGQSCLLASLLACPRQCVPCARNAHAGVHAHGQGCIAAIWLEGSLS